MSWIISCGSCMLLLLLEYCIIQYLAIISQTQVLVEKRLVGIKLKVYTCVNEKTIIQHLKLLTTL